MKTDIITEFAKLDKSEKILLVEELWETISEDESDIPIPESHIKELETRRAEYASAPGRLLPVQELADHIERRKYS